MDAGSIHLLIIIIILIILSAFFSSAETSLTMVSKTRMTALASQGSKRAEWVLKLVSNPSRLLTTILIGNNAVNLTASALTTTLASKMGGMATGIATGILTLAILILGEITPKTMATVKAEQLSLLYSPVILFLFYALTPVIVVLNAFTGAILFLFRVDPDAKRTMSEQELRILVDESHQEGVTTEEEKDMINNVFDFGDSDAKDVMTPGVDIVSIHVDDSLDEIMSVYDQHKYTRMPVYDSNDRIIGILNIKDLLYEMARADEPDDFKKINVKSLLWKPFFASEYQKTSDLLALIRQAKCNMVLVVDEFGVLSGLVTMEDLVEEIVGELRDEYDADEENEIIKMEPHVYSIDGGVRLDDINDELGIELSSEEYDSIGGLVMELLDHVPVVGEVATEHNYKFEVTDMDKAQIKRVKLTVLNDEARTP